ncbi:hypothetical protein [Ramlibacter sp. Leaf400]|uniref:hypothetical protein n=1 Tax=Ramlibacter sp. Leaf400 TaxID=1736365 RepID=UPI0006FD23E0|nr:hypothetical protein [Ramlibacter sp. Leaf400]KQT08860.1 hypothetical protein ASG30_15365 [Ramlibacter sp. Leaf400]
MGPLDFLPHLAAFLAPAVFLALILPAVSRLLLRTGAGYWRQAIPVFLASVATLAGGLVWFGRDGKMATYAAVVLAAATAQWLAARAWK